MILTLIVVFSALFVVARLKLNRGASGKRLMDKLGRWPVRGLFSRVSFGTPGQATVLIFAALTAFVLPISADEPGRQFTATAVVDGSQGTRQMPVTLVANRFTSVEEAKQLAQVLEQGGQGALLSALSGRSDGQLQLGALQMPVALVVAEPRGNGYRYLFLTARRIRVEETTLGEKSLDYPFGVAVFEVDGFGDGEGKLHVEAALHIDADGHVEVEDYDGADGTLENVEQVQNNF
jgi:hypothetical protein